MNILKIIFLVFAVTVASIGCTKSPQLVPNDKTHLQTQTEQTTSTTQQPSTQNPESSSSTPITQPAKESQVKIYLIALNDNGKIGKDFGTGDSLVSVDRTISTPQTPLKAAFNELLSLKESHYGNSGLYNALYRSNLKLEKATITDGKAEVYLTGSLLLGGIMDNPRVENQLNATALQFSTVKEAQIYINNKTLRDALSLK